MSAWTIHLQQHGGYLQEVDEVAQHQPVELRKRLHHGDGRHRVVTVSDALHVEVHGDERLLQLPIPELHQRGWTKSTVFNMHVQTANTEKNLHLIKNISLPHRGYIGVREILWDPPLVHLELQCVHFINVSRHSEGKTHCQLHSAATRGSSNPTITPSPCPVANPLHVHTQLA